MRFLLRQPNIGDRFQALRAAQHLLLARDLSAWSCTRPNKSLVPEKPIVMLSPFHPWTLMVLVPDCSPLLLARRFKALPQRPR